MLIKFICLWKLSCYKSSHFFISTSSLPRESVVTMVHIFFITLCAAISRADDWATIEEFGKSNEEWFTELLDLFFHGYVCYPVFHL